MNYDLQTIQTAFKSLVKFKQDYSYTSLTSGLDSDLLGVSDSGKYFNVGVNPLITLKNIEALMPPVSGLSVVAWSGSITYGLDDCVSSGGLYYRSKVAGNLNHAVGLTTYWAVTTLYSIWLRQKLNGLYETVLSKTMLSDQLIDHVKFYIHTNQDDLLTNSGNYVGYEIRPKNSEHLKIILNRIATQFSQSQASIDLKLYNQNTLVSTITLSNLIAGELAFTNITDQTLSGEGRWFLFYDQDDLTGQACNWIIDSPGNYVDILPFEVSNTTTDFVDDVSSHTLNTYGLGLDLSVYADLTRFILDNLQAFSEVIHLQWQYDILELFLLNPDVKFSINQRNLEGNNVREIILGELKSENHHSLVSKLNWAYKNLIKSFDFGDIALPGTNDQSIIFNTYG